MSKAKDNVLPTNRQIAAAIKRLPAYRGYGMQFACLIFEQRPFGRRRMSNGSGAASTVPDL
jgi:hypothetical protein